MKNKILIIALVLIVAGAVWYFSFYNKKPTQQMANPASVYCEEQGGVLKTIDFESGQDSLCSFDDKSICWEWDFYRGECKKGDLKMEVLKEGAGKPANKGDNVVVNYVGKLENGMVFDASSNHGGPFSFLLGGGVVIKGWDYGVLGMRKGEKRQLTIAPGLAYGDTGAGGVIPPGATLIFEVELLEIK